MTFLINVSSALRALPVEWQTRGGIHAKDVDRSRHEHTRMYPIMKQTAGVPVLLRTVWWFRFVARSSYNPTTSQARQGTIYGSHAERRLIISLTRAHWALFPLQTRGHGMRNGNVRM